ncbi:MAG: hypothetical protein ACHQPI_10925 [Thermoanaerobaculia bacterium]
MRGFARAGIPFLVGLLTGSAETGVAQSAGPGTPFAGATVCPLPAILLAGPSSVRPGSTYSLSWNNVLGGASGTVYGVDRSADPTFASGVEHYSTDQTAYAFPALVLSSTSVSKIYHRVSTKNPCTSPASTATSPVLAIPVKTDCPTPGTLGSLTADPPGPPSGSTYVVTWFRAGPGIAGAQTTLDGILFRVRRTAADVVKEWVTDRTSASFVDAPGTYQYQARAEATCGSVGPWSTPILVNVVQSGPQLVLVSAPKPIVVAWPLLGTPSTRFTVRNAGTGKAAAVTVSTNAGILALSPASFSIAPGQNQDVVVTLVSSASMLQSVSVPILLDAGNGVTLGVPVTFLAAAASQTPVLWNLANADVNVRGDPITAKILNPNYAAAPFAPVIGVPWLSVSSADGNAWNRPLDSREVRSVQISVDRSQRRSPTGTETGTIALVTPGTSASPSVLVVSDDGAAPLVTVSPGGVGAPTGVGGSPARTRVLFPSLANNADAKGVGWFSSDVWVTNSDAENPVDLSILMTPVARPQIAGPGVFPPPAPSIQRIDVRLSPGETRRFRNLLAWAGLFGASSVEIRSTATTVSATAVVNNQPKAPGALSYALATGDPVDQTPVIPPPRYFGSEMRPVSPGEGVKVTDPQFVISGLAFDANRRTNLLLAETSGLDTLVRIQLYQSDGSQATLAGAPVDMTVTVGAGQTVQINYPDLFDPAATYVSAYFYALVTYQPGASAGGSVVPMATVLDNVTQDFSLHVGASTRSLDPTNIPAAQSVAASGAAFATAGATSSLPYGGGPSPLFFPVGHSIGAPLAGGVQPFWKTRVTLTNTNQLESRQGILTLLDQTGTAPITRAAFLIPPGWALFFDDLLVELFSLPQDGRAYGGIRLEASERPDGTWASTWQDVDVQTEIYTADPNATTGPVGEYKTGMEAYPYWHGYSSFQSNLGSLQMEGAESSSQYRTNLILQEVGGASVTVAVAVYTAGSFVPLAQTTISLQPYDYYQRELFHNILGLDLGELTDVRVVVRQTAGDGVFMAFVSKINLATGDPANIFLRPAMAGTGR